jgi:O-antigen/teichoic acid export membrane protein
VSLPLGIAFIGIATAAIVGYACLVVVGRVRALAVSTLIGALVGAPLILLFAAAGSVPAVAWAVAVSELCVAGYQVLVLRAELRRPAKEAAS